MWIFKNFTNYLPWSKRIPIPRVLSAIPIGDHTLLVEFNNCEKRKYDITQLLEKDIFAPLENPAFCKAVQVEKGGYAVYWNSKIDISEYELWCHGQLLS